MIAREKVPDPQDPPADGSESGREPTTHVVTEETRTDRPGLCGVDPFETFTEWSGPADEADHADL